MSERKVLNKYYPPDFDPSKIPRAKCPKNRQFTVRLMAPCNMKCLTCGEYIAKAKKFNARKEDVENMSYLGIRIYRFYIKCPGCLAEISFRTDPESTDYIIEAGAHRNFQALKLAEEQAEREERENREEIESNPMLLLENRTQQSQHEMEILESLEDLRELNERHAVVDLESMIEKYEKERTVTKELQDEVDRLAALKALGYEVFDGKLIKRLPSESINDDDEPDTKKFKSDMNYLKLQSNYQKKESATLKSKFAGLVRFPSKKVNDGYKLEKQSDVSSSESKDADPNRNQQNKDSLGGVNQISTAAINNSSGLANTPCSSNVAPSHNPSLKRDVYSNQSTVSDSKNERNESVNSIKASTALSFLGAYSDSESEDET